eukprot:493473-Alexandrium_andersonii.AAC.1
MGLREGAGLRGGCLGQRAPSRVRQACQPFATGRSSSTARSATSASRWAGHTRPHAPWACLSGSPR